MRKRRLVFSDAAIADILEQAGWYAAHSGARLARRWENAVSSSVTRVVRHPAVSATCAFRPLVLKDVRRTTISGFPKHLLFYRFNDDEVFVLRVVHGARDLEGLFS